MCKSAKTIRCGYQWDTRCGVTHLSKEDIERELAKFETKYGITSQEFVAKWNDGELDCAVGEHFDWAGLCHSAYDNGRTDLKIIDEGVEELEI